MTWRKMAHLGFDPVEETRFHGGATSGRFYRIPVNRFTWGLKRQGVKAAGRRRPGRGVPERATQDAA